MEFKHIVQGGLRQLSLWIVDGWYSDVHVEGASNVPKTGPLILAATHHNEIVDVAVLSARIPHERPIGYWAKSSMFKHPFTKFWMENSGALSVTRNPNYVETSNASTSDTSSNGGLFKDTVKALSQGQVIGIFPEGTSYTLPAIAQVLPGAARAAIEYARSVRREKLEGMKSDRERQIYLNGVGRHGEVTGLRIVPVGIVYEDKERYMSRVCVGFGEPIDVDKYTQELFQEGISHADAAKCVVKKLNAELERRLLALTVNAPDWGTFYAAQMAMKILWGDEENVPLETWVKIMQSLVDMFSSDPKLDSVRKALVRYHALLYYTGIDHAILEEVLPLSPTSANLTYPLLWDTFAKIAVGFPVALAQFFAFLPAFFFHVPGYITALSAVRMLSGPGEAETKAEYGAAGGGIGIGLTVLVSLVWLMRRLMTFGKLILGRALPCSLSMQELQKYNIRPPPSVNVFIKNDQSSAVRATKRPPPITPHKLVQEMLLARLQAHISLGNYMRHSDSKETTFLLSQGGRVPFVVA
ncbi:hypothetical protein AGABI2DRAFT_228041 [Agaricus bisporus var. bisporus H97]|uniref:hypothetical protein n=1 Tax=Agaricus bisporus var. bisporus (strain H97 / ATCC MYA-4626 / FGSC 10389) TaxID=936046 RepID=UPI00029F5CB3|nr:hypothetical protein AGABI2DRAFT_228041 [Agaricus bisporus var. bisporus H97]EKV43204.1 hypothetical protein AGABI2DRAFT_228041 [Agaricus bisporus var. bisporus H97]